MADYPVHEITLGLPSFLLPVSDFSDVSNPGIGFFDINYKVRVNPYLGFDFETGYNYFVPKQTESVNLKVKYNYSNIPFFIGATYSVLGFKKTFSPYTGIRFGFAFVRTHLKNEVLISPDSVRVEEKKISGAKFALGLNFGFYISLIALNFSYYNIFTGDIKNQYLVFGIKYRIPVNE